MLRFGKIFFGILLSLVISAPSLQAEAKAPAQPAITGQFGVAIDASTGEILYDKNAKKHGYPASITKVLTAILLDEMLINGEKVTASATAVKQDPSNQVFLLREGEQLTKEDALKAMMIKSSNDVTYAVAEKVAGNKENFAKLMNKKAKEIGAKNSNFVTPNGLHDNKHVTTPYDIALITKEAMKHPNVLKAMGTKEDVIRTNQREVKIVNKSKILDNPVALGGKTGYTRKAQNTLVEILHKEGKTVIAVVMKTTLAQEYKDIAIMGNYAFHKLSSKKIVKTGQVVDTIEVEGQQVSLLAAQDYVLTFVKGKKPDYDTKVETNQFKQGFNAGDIIGKLNVFKDGKVIKQIPLTSDKTVLVAEKREIKIKDVEKSGMNEIFMLIIGVGIILALFIGFVISRNLRQRKSPGKFEGETG